MLICNLKIAAFSVANLAITTGYPTLAMNEVDHGIVADDAFIFQGCDAFLTMYEKLQPEIDANDINLVLGVLNPGEAAGWDIVEELHCRNGQLFKRIKRPNDGLLFWVQIPGIYPYNQE